MTQEIKERLKQAATAHAKGSFDYESAYIGFKKGAQTILENPGGWGLVEKRLVDAGIQLRIETIKACEETHLQNEKYRGILEKLLKEDMCSYAGDRLIKEALNQQ